MNEIQIQFDGFVRTVAELAVMPSGKIVVVTTEEEGGPESYWFNSDGTHPKSQLYPWPLPTSVIPSTMNTHIINQVDLLVIERDQLKERITQLEQAIEKVRGFGPADLTAGELCDFVNEVANEVLPPAQKERGNV